MCAYANRRILLCIWTLNSKHMAVKLIVKKGRSNYCFQMKRIIDGHRFIVSLTSEFSLFVHVSQTLILWTGVNTIKLWITIKVKWIKANYLCVELYVRAEFEVEWNHDRMGRSKTTSHLLVCTPYFRYLSHRSIIFDHQRTTHRTCLDKSDSFVINSGFCMFDFSFDHTI